MKYKILIAIGITILFLCVIVQPAFAVTPKTTDSEDGCNICPKANNKQNAVILKRLIDRLENHNNKLSPISKYNPEIERKHNEILDRITALKEMNVESNPDDYPKICLFLLILVGIAINTYSLMFEIQTLIRAIGRLNLYYISLILGFPIQIILWIPLILFGVFDCSFYPY